MSSKLVAIHIDQAGKIDAPSNEADFYKYISSRYLLLDKEPKEKFLDFFYQAKNDLDNINDQVCLIDKGLAKLESKKKENGWLNGKDRYKRRLYEYYKEKNQAAKDEILRFISEDIESHALMKSRENFSFDSVITPFLASPKSRAYAAISGGLPPLALWGRR